MSTGTLSASSLVPNFPDLSKVWKQIGVCNPDSLAAAMSNPTPLRKRIANQMVDVHKAYFDIEPGMDNPVTPKIEGWLREDVQEFAIDILHNYPNCSLFPGASFSQLIVKDLNAAKRVAAAAPLGLIFPAYHGPNWTIDRYRSAWSTRLAIVRDSGLLTAISLSRTATGPTHDHVPDDLFLAAVELCRTFCPNLMIWNWDAPWQVRSALETRTIFRTGDEELAVLSSGTV